MQVLGGSPLDQVNMVVGREYGRTKETEIRGGGEDEERGDERDGGRGQWIWSLNFINLTNKDI
jgi:hypothetical protein